MSLEKTEDTVDKLFYVLSTFYDFVASFAPTVIAEMPLSLQAQINWILGEINVEEFNVLDDSIAKVIEEELSSHYEACIITDCITCKAWHTVNYLRHLR